MRTLEHFIGGQSVAGTSGKFGEVFDPNQGIVQARVPLATLEELDRAEANAAEMAIWVRDPLSHPDIETMDSRALGDLPFGLFRAPSLAADTGRPVCGRPA